MSQSLHVVAFTPPDEKWLKMKAVWDACVDADMDIPEDVREYFNYHTPEPNGREITLRYPEWTKDEKWGIDVDISSIPKNAKIIRFFVSW